MAPKVETLTPPDTPVPVGPYSHIAKVGSSITIGGIGGVDPATGKVAGDGVAAQTEQILRNFEHLLTTVGSDLDHIVHINIFMRDIGEFGRMNDAYVRVMGERRPARTVIEVGAVPKAEFHLTMNLTAVTAH